MNSPGHLLQFAFVAGLVLALALALTIRLGERLLRRILSGRGPAERARLAWWLLVTPAVSGLGYMILAVSQPFLSKDLVALDAACSSHANSLLHLCVWHPTDSGHSAWLWGLIAVLTGSAAWLLGRAFVAVWRSRQFLGTLIGLSQRSEQLERVHVVDVDVPMAISCDIGKGHILLSRPLIEQLNATQLCVIVAHEQSHLDYQDARWRIVASALSVMHLPGTRRRLLADLDMAIEQRSDLAAAAVVGCPIQVAETLVAVEKLFSGRGYRPGLSMAFLSDSIRERVEALLATHSARGAGVGVWLCAGVLAYCSLSTGWLHGLTESIISLR